MQLVNLSNNAYDACREPGADTETIQRKYGAMCEQLEKTWTQQGLQVTEVNDRAGVRC